MAYNGMLCDLKTKQNEDKDAYRFVSAVRRIEERTTTTSFDSIGESLRRRPPLDRFR